MDHTLFSRYLTLPVVVFDLDVPADPLSINKTKTDNQFHWAHEIWRRSIFIFQHKTNWPVPALIWCIYNHFTLTDSYLEMQMGYSLPLLDVVGLPRTLTLGYYVYHLCNTQIHIILYYHWELVLVMRLLKPAGSSLCLPESSTVSSCLQPRSWMVPRTAIPVTLPSSLYCFVLGTRGGGRAGEVLSWKQ